MPLAGPEVKLWNRPRVQGGNAVYWCEFTWHFVRHHYQHCFVFNNWKHLMIFALIFNVWIVGVRKVKFISHLYFLELKSV